MASSLGFFSFFSIITLLYTVTMAVLGIWALVLAIKALNIYIRNNS